MLSTTDAGTTWNSYQLPTGTMDYGDYGDMACPSTTVCYAPGSIDNQTVPVVLATKDGGKTWIVQSLPGGLGPWIGAGSSITCPSTSVCYEGDPVAPLMLSTTDGGATWAAVSLPSTGAAVTPTCASTVLCYAIDGNGVVKTTDGTTWSTLTSEPLPATQLVCPSASACYVVDNGPDSVAVTQDGGQTWSVQYISAGLASNLTCATATTCFLTGNQPGSADFAKTTDGGQSWMTGQIPTGLTFDGAGGANSLICPAPNNCYAAVSEYPNGSGTFVISTTDDGATWTTSPLPNGDAPTAALVCPTATVCFAPDSFTTVLTNAPEVTSQIQYVALGDSYSSGEANPPFVKAEGKCDLSQHDAWPELLAAADSRLNLVGELACSGAWTSALTSSFKGQSPQLTAMQPLNPNLVTVTIGGNNIGFAPTLEDCWLLRHNCVKDGKLAAASAKIQALGKSIVNVYDVIKKDSLSGASTLVVGYPRLFPLKRGTVGLHCPWLATDEQSGLNALAMQLNTTLREAATKAGVTYVPTLNAFTGHELCTGKPWVRAIQLNNRQYSGHPLLRGQEALAAIVERAIG
jgi:photosystem II stability/assembly factor-like uncharacterized protein/lysophospholipase L1-like esterase